MENRIKTLRDRKPLKLWDKTNKMFVQIQFNNKEKFVCWERWVSVDKQSWINWNKYLSLKDVVRLLKDFGTQKNNLSIVII